MLFCFGVGLANFSTGRRQRPGEIVAAIAARLPLIASYGSTGNVALHDGDIGHIQKVLRDVTDTPWAVVTMAELDGSLTKLASLPEPRHSADVRPTPGLAFAVTKPGRGEVVSAPHAVLHRISERVVAVVKLDRLLDGKLDRDRRQGGWGAISAEIARQVKGQWTARSRRTLDGLRSRAARATRTRSLSK